MAKTLYHSQFRELGPTEVFVKSDVLKSKYSKPNAPKPDYIVLTINGEDFNYSSENQKCADFFKGHKGRTFTIQAEGGGKDKEDTAEIIYLGEPGTTVGQQPKPTSTPKTAPSPRAPAPPPRQNAPPPPQTPPRPATAGGAKPAAGPGHGQRVGMAINQACQYLMHEGQPWDPKLIFERASDLIRVSGYLEDGHLAPAFAERQKNPVNRQQ